MLSGDCQRGTLLGLTIGNAMGANVDFELPESFPDVTGYDGGGPQPFVWSFQ